MSSAAARPDTLNTRHRNLVMGCTMIATLMQALDNTIANVALPHMQGTLGASRDQITWVLTSYVIAAAILTAPVGLVRRALRPQAVLHRLARRLHRDLDAVRFRAERCRRKCCFVFCRAVSARLSCRSRRPSCSTSIRSEQRGTAMAIWATGVMIGPILGPDARRLADRCLRLALGLLHQRAVRDLWPSPAWCCS